jgi:hypothetical protein
VWPTAANQAPRDFSVKHSHPHTPSVPVPHPPHPCGPRFLALIIAIRAREVFISLVRLTRRNTLYTTLLSSLAEQDALLVPLYAELLKLDKDSHGALETLMHGLDGEVERAGKVGKGCWVTLRNEILGESATDWVDDPHENCIFVHRYRSSTSIRCRMSSATDARKRSRKASRS